MFLFILRLKTIKPLIFFKNLKYLSINIVNKDAETLVTKLGLKQVCFLYAISVIHFKKDNIVIKRVVCLFAVPMYLL